MKVSEESQNSQSIRPEGVEALIINAFTLTAGVLLLSIRTPRALP